MSLQSVSQKEIHSGPIQMEIGTDMASGAGIEEDCFTFEGTISGHEVATESQRRIIDHPPTHNCLLTVKAGPGSGKTFTLTNRVANLIKNHLLKPSEILVLSMANRSVISLRNALTRELGEDITSQIDLSTFHLFCGKLVDNYHEQYSPQLKNKRLMDDLNWRLFSTIFLNKFINLNGKSIQGTLTASNFEKLVSSVRTGKLTIEEAAKQFKVNKEYLESLLEYLDANGVIRYNDLISNAKRIIDASLEPGNQNGYIGQLHNYKVVIVDEFQDMYDDLLTVVEYVVKYPTEGKEPNTCKHITIAGDPHQSIYEFLGSRFEMMDEIETHFPNLQVEHKLINECFRCSPEILDGAIKTCQGNTDLTSHFQSVKEPGHLPVLSVFKDPTEEYNFIINEIIRICCELGGLIKLSDIAILARSNKEIEDFNRILSDNYGISYNKLNSSLSWVKSKVHIFLTILNLLESNNNNELLLLYLLLSIDTDLGNKTRVSKLFSLSRKWGQHENLKFDVLEDYLINNLHGNLINDKDYSIKKIYKKGHESKIKSFELLIDSVVDIRTNLSQNYSNQTPDTILECLLQLVEKLKLINYLNEPPAPKRLLTLSQLEMTNLNYKKDLSSDLNAFHRSLLMSYKTYTQQDILNTQGDNFLKYFLKSYNDDYPLISNDLVNTSTIHAAKGLEFPVVFIPGSSNYYNGPWCLILTRQTPVPSSGARLLYVGLTRAKNLLYLGAKCSIGEIDDEVLDSYTTMAPKFNDSFLLLLSKDLNRKNPSSHKLQQGVKLFKSFNQLQNQKFLHTSAIVQQQLGHRYGVFNKSINLLNLCKRK